MSLDFNKRGITRLTKVAILVVVIAAAVVATALYWQLTAPPPGAGVEIKVGFIAPLTGAAAPAGAEIKKVATLIEEEFNKKGGIPSGPMKGAKLKVILADTQTRVDVAISEAERLITTEKVNFLAGGLYSSVAKAVIPIADKYQIPYISDVPSSATLNRLGAKFYFRAVYDDDIAIKTFFMAMRDLQKKTGIKCPRLGLLYANDEFGIMGAEMCKKWNKDPEIGGYEIVAEIPFAVPATDVSSEILTMKAAKPDWIIWAAHEPDGVLVPKAMFQYDLNVKAVFDYGDVYAMKAVRDGAKDYAVGICSKGAWCWDVKSPTSEYWDKLFYDKYGYHLPDARYWMPLIVIVKAVEKAGSVDPFKLQQTMYDMVIPASELITPYGVDFMEPGTESPGFNRLAIGIVKQMFGKWPDVVQYTVWPFEYASKEAVFPLPTWAERGLG